MEYFDSLMIIHESTVLILRALHPILGYMENGISSKPGDMTIQKNEL